MKTLGDLQYGVAKLLEKVLDSDRAYHTWKESRAADHYEKLHRKSMNALVEYLIEQGLGKFQVTFKR